MKTIEILTIERPDDSTMIVDAKYLEQVGLSKDELKAAFPEKVKEHKVVFKAQNFAMKREINKAAQVPDLITGFKLDPDLIPAARAAVVVDHWSFDQPVSVEGFEKLPYIVGEYISAEITAYLYPDISRDPDFFGAWIAKQQSSAAPQQESGSP